MRKLLFTAVCLVSLVWGDPVADEVTSSLPSPSPEEVQKMLDQAEALQQRENGGGDFLGDDIEAITDTTDLANVDYTEARLPPLGDASPSCMAGERPVKIALVRSVIVNKKPLRLIRHVNFCATPYRSPDTFYAIDVTELRTSLPRKQGKDDPWKRAGPGLDALFSSQQCARMFVLANVSAFNYLAAVKSLPAEVINSAKNREDQGLLQHLEAFIRYRDGLANQKELVENVELYVDYVKTQSLPTDESTAILTLLDKLFLTIRKPTKRLSLVPRVGQKWSEWLAEGFNSVRLVVFTANEVEMLGALADKLGDVVLEREGGGSRMADAEIQKKIKKQQTGKIISYSLLFLGVAGVVGCFFISPWVAATFVIILVLSSLALFWQKIWFRAIGPKVGAVKPSTQ